MTDNMMELLRKRRATAAVRSITASENNEQRVHTKAQATKELLGNTNTIDEDRLYATQLAHYYYEMKAAYSGKRVVTHAKDSQRSRDFWTKVQEACREAGVEPERYMKAQFSFFHTAFGTTPKLNQLATPSAVDRAKAFEGKTTGKVVANAIEAKVDLGPLFARCDKQVREVCAAQKVSREDYYRKFVLTHLIPMPRAFLDADPVYQRVANES